MFSESSDVLCRSLPNVGYGVLIDSITEIRGLVLEIWTLDIILLLKTELNNEYFADLPATLCLHCVISVVMGFNCG